MYVGIFFDLEKFFCCKNHEILIAKLHFYGIQGVSEDWFRSYLTNRRQKFEVKSPNSIQNFFSDWDTVEHRVPQGATLGPLLFIIYITELPLRINSVSESILYADDKSVITSSRNFKDFCSLSNIILSCMIKWFGANNLVLNLDKINTIKFITKNS